MSGAAPSSRWPASASQEISRWTTAAAVVVAAHLSLAYGVGSMVEKEPRPAAEEALAVDLTPFIMTQAEQEQPDVLREETTEPLPEEVQQGEVVEETVPIPETPPDEQPVEAETEIAQVQTETAEPDRPDLVTETIETPPAEVTVPKPVNQPIKKVEKTPPKGAKKPLTKRAAATEPAKGKDRATQSEAKAARAPSVSPARWHSQVYAAIARRKPRDRSISGRVSIRFVVSSSGSIVSADVARSSGNSTLDRAALAMVRNARVPAPPANLPGARHPFTIPVVFQ
jgi:protein TonB